MGKMFSRTGGCDSRQGMNEGGKMRMVIGILKTREVEMLHTTNISTPDMAEGTVGADPIVRRFRRMKKSELSDADIRWAGESVAFHAGGSPWCIVEEVS